tara:strand:+ start:609 stop:839 length:231 start_codon:yes stop_codon:yes gene_type:complete
MWSILVTTMLAVTEVPAMPVIIFSYPTLKQCRLELIDISKKLDYELIVNPMLGYIAQKKTEEKTTVAFCAKNLQSI